MFMCMCDVHINITYIIIYYYINITVQSTQTWEDFDYVRSTKILAVSPT